MIRLSANLSKKVPLPGIDYSSQQYGASLEIEVSDADRPEAIQGRIRELYNLLSSAIDEQIGVAHPNTARTLPPPVTKNSAPVALPVQQRNGYATGQNRVAAVNGNGNVNGRATGATAAQQKAVWAICKNLGVNISDVLSEFSVGDVKALSVKQASKLIDSLKSRQNSPQ